MGRAVALQQLHHSRKEDRHDTTKPTHHHPSEDYHDYENAAPDQRRGRRPAPETINAIEENPSLAKFRFRARSEWIEGARCHTQFDGFYGAGQEDESRTEPFVVEGDEPPVLLGTNQAPNAVEAVLHALVSCLSVGFVYNAAAQGITVESLDFELEGNLDLHAFLGLSDETRPGYEGITVNYRVKADAPEEKLDELCAYVQRTSPVMDIIRNPVPVTVRRIQ